MRQSTLSTCSTFDSAVATGRAEVIVADLALRVHRWVRGSDANVRSGLLGFVSIAYGELLLDGVCVRRTSDQRYCLSFPAREDRSGHRHCYFRPANEEAWRAIEHEILTQLGELGELVP